MRAGQQGVCSTWLYCLFEIHNVRPHTNLCGIPSQRAEMNLRIMQFIKCFDYFCFNYAPLPTIASPLSLGERFCGQPRLSVCHLQLLLLLPLPSSVALATTQQKGKRILIKIFSISALNLKYVPQYPLSPPPPLLCLALCLTVS